MQPNKKRRRSGRKVSHSKSRTMMSKKTGWTWRGVHHVSIRQMIYTHTYICRGWGLRVEGLSIHMSLQGSGVHRDHVAWLHSENFALHGTHTHTPTHMYEFYPTSVHTHTHTHTHTHNYAYSHTHTHFLHGQDSPTSALKLEFPMRSGPSQADRPSILPRLVIISRYDFQTLIKGCQ